MTGLIDDLQDLINYCKEEPPPYLGDSHAIRFDLSKNFEDSDDRFEYRGFLLFKPEPGQHPYYLQGYGYMHPIANLQTLLGVTSMVRIGVAIGRQPVVEAALEFGYVHPQRGDWIAERPTDGDASYAGTVLDAHQLQFSSAGERRVASLYKGVLIPH